jgi:hypothetical protein
MAIYTIYRIRDNTTGETYIGSTKQKLEDRIYQHKILKDCKSRKIIKNNNYTIKSLLKVNSNKTTALWLERFSTNNHYKVVNKQRSIVSREDRRDYSKEYYKKNRVNKQSISCQCGGKYKYHHKSTHMKTTKHQNFIKHAHQKL